MRFARPAFGDETRPTRRRLGLAGTPIPVNDTWIAALAREHALPILSADTHFDAVRDINPVGW